jgi:hypothetical protein
MTKAIAPLLILAALALPLPATAHAGPGCDQRWQACNSPVWCETTGSYLPPFSGFCPVGPPNYPQPRTGR